MRRLIMAVITATVLPTLLSAASKSYDVVPYADCVAQTTIPHTDVVQYVRNTLDSLSAISVWIGDTFDTSSFNVIVVDSAVPTHQIAHNTDPGHPTQCWAWLNLPLTKDAKPVRGRTYKVVVSRPLNASAISFAYDPNNPYRYGHISVRNANPQPDTLASDLALRILGLHNTIDSTYWGVDDPLFVPWYEPDGENRNNLRNWAAHLADSAGVGTMMVYASWPELVGDNDTTLVWSQFDAHLWEVKQAQCRPVINITGVAKYASSRQDSIWKRTWIGDTTHDSGYWFYYRVWDTAVFCAPKNLFAPIEDDTNYWARYIEELVTHGESEQWRRSWEHPCSFVHTWEIYNEPNDTCVNSMLYFGGITGFWRRPTLQYTSGFDGLPGLCALYERMAYVAAQVIRSCPGHTDDTILIGSTHRALDSTPGVLVRGIDFMRGVYEAASQSVFWDGISFHPYQGGCGFHPGLFEESAESLRAVARVHGDDDCLLWCTEVSVFPEDMGSKQYFQMRYLPQLYTTALGSQALPGVGCDQCQWFTFSQINGWWPESLGLIGLFKENVDNETIWDGGWWGKHSSFYTFRTLTEELTNHRLERRVLMNDSTEDSLMRVYEFSDPESNDRRVWVGWAVDTTSAGETPVSISAQAPVRTDCVVVGDGIGPESTLTADADGWLRLTLTRQVQYMREDGPATRPDLAVDSFRVMPERPQVGKEMGFVAYVRNTDSARATPDTVWYRFLCDTTTICSVPGPSIGPLGRDTVTVIGCVVQNWMRGDHLFRLEANPGQKFVEKDGLDDNDGYSRNKVVRPPVGDIGAVLCGHHGNEPPALLRIESHSLEADTTGQTPCDSARLVQWWYGLNDTVVHSGDTTAWFCVNEAVSLDTSWLYLSGQGEYKMFLQVKDSWSMSDLIPDTTHPFIVFATTGPAGSIVINDGARFATSSTCTLALTAVDSVSGVAAMRFINDAPKVDLVVGGSFTATAGSFEYENAEIDTLLHMAKLTAAPVEASVTQFIPAESISAHAGDSCAMEASVMAHVHEGDAAGSVSFWFLSTRPDTWPAPETLYQLVDSASFSGHLLSLTGRSCLSKRFTLAPPDPGQDWVWKGGMVKVEASAENGNGDVWVDDVRLQPYEPDSGYFWWGNYDTLAAWNIGSGAGQHVVHMCLLDSAGVQNADSYADTVILDPTAPVVHITQPLLGQLVNGALEITGWAYDPVEIPGDTWFKSYNVTFRNVDSTNWLPANPDSCSSEPAYPDSGQILGPAVHLGYWNTESIPDGDFYLKLTATDSAGNVSSCSTWVVVSNNGGGGNFCAGPPGGGTGLGEGSCYVGSADGTVLHLTDALDSLDAFSVCDSGSQANVTAILEVGDDSLLVLDAHNKRIHKLHKNGQHRRRLVSGLSQPADLKRDVNGNFYLVDRGWHRIGKFRSNGTLVFVRGGQGTDSLHFHSPEGIAVKGGLVYVADGGNNRVAVWDTSGNFKTTITGDFENPTAVMVTDSGPIYLTDGNDGKLKGITPLGGNIVSIGTTDSSKLRGLVLSENKNSLFSIATQPNKVYKLRIQSDESMPGGQQSAGKVNLPKTLNLAQPFPNPARTLLNIAYALPHQTRVVLKLYDVAGKLVTTLTNGEQKPGYYNLTWNRQDTKGRSCACGVYFCSLSAENQRFSRKVVLTE
jgi:hypothetical protein